MSPAALFLTALGQALATIALYDAGHPARTAARDRLAQALRAVLADRPVLRFSFLDHEIVCETTRLLELRGWEWGARFTRARVSRLEIDAQPTPTDDDLDELLIALHTRIATPGGADLPNYTRRGIRIGRLDTVQDDLPMEPSAPVDALLDGISFTEEVDCVRWIHDQASLTDAVPMAEVEGVVRGLSLAMHRNQGFVLPLLSLKTQDQYTTMHCCNVAMLSMGLAEQVGLRPSDVRAIGTAALLHDIGKVRVSLEVLVKPGKLTDEEFAEMKRHTVEGARILGERGKGHALAAIVAYEHHAWLNGAGGYPVFRYPRPCHYASRLVHVCDLYDALSTDRPYRKAWPRERTIAMLQSQRGIEVDAELVDAFVAMLARREEPRRTVAETPVTSDWNAALARTASTYE